MGGKRRFRYAWPLKSYGRGSLIVKCCGDNLKLDTYRLYNPIELPEVVWGSTGIMMEP